MTHLLFRIHQQDNHQYYQDYYPPAFWERMLYFLVSYALLLIVSWFFHRRSVTAQLTFPIHPLPTESAQDVIYYCVVIFLGVIGIYVVIGNLWTTYEWILYFIANVLVSLYVFLYQITSFITLILTSITAVALAIDLQWLFIQTTDMHRDFSDFIIRNFVGAVGAWAVIYTLITLGQFLVYTIGVNKTFQAVCFFIAGILLIVGIALWNRHSYSTWGELIGFIGVGTLLLLFSAANTQRYSSGNGSSLLS